jgi:hypothetical protein
MAVIYTDLAGKVVLVTGIGSGIGEALYVGGPAVRAFAALAVRWASVRRKCCRTRPSHHAENQRGSLRFASYFPLVRMAANLCRAASVVISEELKYSLTRSTTDPISSAEISNAELPTTSTDFL